MTTPRISVLGDLRVHGREVEIIVKPRWSHTDLDAAEALASAPVNITIEPASAPPEPLTGGAADINVRVRIRRDWIAGSFLAGKTGVLAEYAVDDHAVVRLDDGHFYNIPVVRLERAPDECPNCGKAAP